MRSLGGSPATHLLELHNVGVHHAQPVVENFTQHALADAGAPLQEFDGHLHHTACGKVTDLPDVTQETCQM